MLGVPRMATAPAFLVLSLLVAVETMEETEGLRFNPYPCMPARWFSAYDTFLKRHLPEDQPDSLDQNQWQRFIERNDLCNRPTQSFLRYEDKQQVLGVCSPDGGRRLEGDLCISGREFSFVTVHVDTNTCGIRSITPERKNLILGCDDFDGECLPVHFQGNPDSIGPDDNMPPCQ